jgi:hypothetical protein
VQNLNEAFIFTTNKTDNIEQLWQFNSQRPLLHPTKGKNLTECVRLTAKGKLQSICFLSGVFLLCGFTIEASVGKSDFVFTKMLIGFPWRALAPLSVADAIKLRALGFIN